ncbi:hypothetical protein AB2B41_01770 [Marimonas sp. MJW-29]|uniref:Uncharacterized protein n=1 Tax=Sulfitobacter sediminis TaxID=3234186 RepID=A0ABV3RI44_9RHOB
MGPLRGGLIATALLAPLPAWAEVCDRMRPLWTPGTPATAWDELIALMITPPSLVLLLLSVLVLRFRHQWGALAVVMAWSLWVSFVALSTPDAARLHAISEGCIGSPTLFILAVAAICVAMILYTVPHGRNADTPD